MPINKPQKMAQPTSGIVGILCATYTKKKK